MRPLLAMKVLFAVLFLISRPGFAGVEGGVARVDITPPEDLKATLGGYGARMSKPAIGVHDRLVAKALVFVAGERRFALVTADMLGFPPGFKAALVRRLQTGGWKADELLLLPSHAHTSMEMNALHEKNAFNIPQIGIFSRPLLEFTLDRLADVVTRATAKTVPIGVATTRIQLQGWNRNRRDDSVETDQDLTVTRIDHVDDSTLKPLAVLVNWTAHPTFMGAKDMMFSGGWPGHLQRTVEALAGEPLTAMYYNGAEGDQAPRARPDSGPSSWERAERYGRELGIIVTQEWRKLRPRPLETFHTHAEPIGLPDRTWHPDFLQTGGAEYGLSEKIIRVVLERMVPPESRSVSLRLNDLLIAGVPGELAAGLGTTIKERVGAATGAKYPVIGGLADEWISYMLSEEQYTRGGYEASVSFYGATLGGVVVESVVRGASRLTPDE